MNFDRAILEAFQALAVRYPELNRTIYAAATNDFLKGLVFLAVFWALWFARSRTCPLPRRERRRRLLAGLAALLFALAINRTLASFLPFRPRPAIAGSLPWIPLPDVPPLAFARLSSFPSDHAVLFLGLAFLFLTLHRTLGIIAFLYASTVILLPRLYLGWHWPSDLLAGAVLAALALAMARGLRAWHYGAALWEPLLHRAPGPFYSALFLLTSLVALLFDPIIALL